MVQDNNGRFDAVSTVNPYGVPVGDNSRLEWFAFQMIADFNKEIARNITLRCWYMAFANYETLEAKTIDHRMDLILVAKVNRFINVNMGAIMIYDFDQDSDIQLSQLFNIGFLYSFQNFEDKK